jgi:voltage-gated sodium channel
MTRLAKQTVAAPAFQRFILAVVLLAGLLAGLETSNSLMAAYGPLLHRLNLVVLVIFITEMTLKLAAHGRKPWLYFHDGWNVFDFAVVALCCLPMDSQFAAVLRLARGLRLLRLVTALPRLQLLVGALLKSLGAMGYVTLLLALMFYIYGVAGVHLFGGHDVQHFGSLSAALVSLFRMITLDNWSDIFNAARAGAPIAAALYFVSFILLGTMIMLNLFIGIIMNSMSEMHAEIEARDRARHVKEFGHATLADDVNQLEERLDALKAQATKLKWRLTNQPDRPEEGPFSQNRVKTAWPTRAVSAGGCNAGQACKADLPPARK